MAQEDAAPAGNGPAVGRYVSADSPVRARLEDQIAWYDAKSQRNQRGFKELKVCHQQNWTTYRSTCERLKHEKFLFLGHAGPYAAVPNPEPLLAERVEGPVSQEHAAWVSQRDEAGKRIGGGE